MNIGKREIKLLVVLGVLIYGFIFYTVFVNSYIPQINEVNSKLSEAKEKEKALEKDLENIEQKKSELNTKRVLSERIGNYVPNSSDMYDPLSYMIKLQKLTGNKLYDIKINQPEEIIAATNENNNDNSSNVEQVKSEIDDTGLGEEVSLPTNTNTGPKYYSIAVNFKSDLAYNEIIELLSYIEGGSRRIKVSEFNIEEKKENKDAATPAKATPAANQAGSGTVPIGKIYRVTGTIKLYTQNIEEANKLFNSSKNRYNEYNDSPLVYTISSNTNIGITNNTSTAVATNGSTSSQSDTVTVPDFTLTQTGYFTAGNNFEVEGTDKSSEFFMYKTSGRTDVQLTLNKNTYSMIITYAVGKSKTITGSIPSRDLNASLKVDVGDAKENEKIKVTYKIINNSPHKLRLSIFDPGGRIKVLDRSGSTIKGNSQKEKVSIN
ncbi:MAG TPA: hypothetical protein PK566_06340 [Pseudobacteroides sp.]|nr:hypothetical protein [Pseudobacteroides sp.]